MKIFNDVAALALANLTESQIVLTKSLSGLAPDDTVGGAYYKVLTPAEYPVIDPLVDVTLANGNIAKFIGSLEDLTLVPDPLLLSDGLVSAPTYSFTSETDTGMYLSGAGLLAHAVEGADIITLSAADITVTQPVLGPDGFVGAPTFSFSNETDSGFYLAGAGNVEFTIGGVAILGVNALGVGIVGGVSFSVNAQAPDGLVSAPSYTFSSETNTGMYLNSVNNIGFSVGGVAVMGIVPSGIGVTGDVAITNAPTQPDHTTRKDYVDAQTGIRRKNYIRNGDCRINQRGQSIYSADGYTIDGFEMFQAGSDLQISTIVFDSLDTRWPSNTDTFIQAVKTTPFLGPSEFIRQKIPFPRQFSNDTFTFSFYISTANATGTLLADVNAFINGALVYNSPSLDLSTQVSGDVQKVSFTVTTPNFAAGTTETVNDWFAIRIIGDATTSFDNLFFTNFQIEKGDRATEFEVLPAAEQWAWNRYFYRRDNYIVSQVLCVSHARGADNSVGVINYEPMHKIPVITAGGGPWITATANGGSAGGTIGFVADSVSANVFMNGATGLVAGNASFVSPFPSAGFIEFIAEL